MVLKNVPNPDVAIVVLACYWHACQLETSAAGKNAYYIAHHVGNRRSDCTGDYLDGVRSHLDIECSRSATSAKTYLSGTTQPDDGSGHRLTLEPGYSGIYG